MPEPCRDLRPTVRDYTACPNCFHRADAHAITATGGTCDICSIIRACEALATRVAWDAILGERRRHAADDAAEPVGSGFLRARGVVKGTVPAEEAIRKMRGGE